MSWLTIPLVLQLVAFNPSSYFGCLARQPFQPGRSIIVSSQNQMETKATVNITFETEGFCNLIRTATHSGCIQTAWQAIERAVFIWARVRSYNCLAVMPCGMALHLWRDCNPQSETEPASLQYGNERGFMSFDVDDVFVSWIFLISSFSSFVFLCKWFLHNSQYNRCDIGVLHF